MARKQVLEPFKVIDAGDMSADITQSRPTKVRQLDYVKLDIKWSGGPVNGEIKVEVADQFEKSGTVTTYQELDFLTPISLTGSSGSHQVIILVVAFDLLRVRYVRTSGSGDLDVTIFGKTLGA